MNVPHLRYLQVLASSQLLSFILIFLAPRIGKSRQLGCQCLGHLGLKYLSSLVLSFSIVKFQFFNKCTRASGYEPGEQLATSAQIHSKSIRTQQSLSTTTVNKSIWKNLSPTQLRSLMRVTTAPGLRSLSLTLMIKTFGR